MRYYSGHYFINNLVFYNDGMQKYGRDYFTNLDEFIDFCPFEYVGSVVSNFEGDDTSETVSIFKIIPKSK